MLELEWRDPRQAFDPTIEGVNEKVFQGAYQFDEVSTSWYPQLVLVNPGGFWEQNGVVLRVRPDGTSTLIEAIHAAAETELDMHRFPFDGHRMEAVFEVLGFDRDEVLLEVEPAASHSAGVSANVPQWAIEGTSVFVRDRSAPYAGDRGISSALVLSVDVQRDSFYFRRLVVIPLIVIVLLSFSVFWMDRSSLGDRISVSFIGILTAVTYQVVMGAQLPAISYVTLMHGFLSLSFLVMSATVVVNLVVGACDQRGKHALGDRIDRTCRWVFPTLYFGSTLVVFAVAMTIF